MKFGIPIKLHSKSEKVGNIVINIDYDAKVLSLIKHGLQQVNPELFEELYSKPTQKLFTTSLYFPEAKFTKDKIILNERGEMKLFFSTDDTYLGLNYYNAFVKLSHDKNLTFGPNLNADIGKLYIIELKPIISNNVKFKTMSPLILRDEKGMFISCDNESKIEAYNIALRRNTLTKLENKPELQSMVKDLTFIPIKTRKTVRKSFNTMVECTVGTFMLKGNPALLTFLENTGLGEKTGTFSGMISPA